MFVTQRTINPTYLGADTTQPHIRAAGYTSTANETAKDIMTWSSERPSTPDHIKKYRQTTVLAPGARAKHWGTAEDPVPEGPYGAKTRSQPGQSVAEAIKQGPQTEMSLWHEAQAEGIYHR